MARTLSDVEWSELQELGYDLEPIVAHEVRARGREELTAEIKSALEEAGDAALEVLDEYSVEPPSDVEALSDEVEDLDDNTDKGDAGEGDTEPTGDTEAAEGDEPEGEPTDPADPELVQLQSTPLKHFGSKGDVIAEPVDRVTRLYPHSTFDSVEAAVDRIEAGDGRWNFSLSRLEREELAAEHDEVDE